MKLNFSLFLFSIQFAFLSTFCFSQTSNIDDKLHFTAVARDVNNMPIITSNIYIRIEIFEGSPNGSKIYCEQTPAQTNDFGEFSLDFPNTGNPNTTFCPPATQMSSIQWQTGDKWVKISFQPNGNAGALFVDIATFQFTTVPYAFAARTAERITNFNLTGASNNQVIKFDAASGTWKPANDELGISGAAGGDLSSNYPNPTVDGIQGNSVSATAPQQGQVMMFDNGQWKPATLVPDIAIFEEQKNPGNDFSGTVGTYTKRILNIEVLSSPSVQLTANSEIKFIKDGLYLITGSAYAMDKGNHKIVLRHNSSIVLEGTSEVNQDQIQDASNRAFIMGTISVPQGTTLANPYLCTLDHYSSSVNQGTFGNGINAASSTHETYSQIMIQKIQ